MHLYRQKRNEVYPHNEKHPQPRCEIAGAKVRIRKHIKHAAENLETRGKKWKGLGKSTESPRKQKT